MVSLLDWLAAHESVLSATAAIIAIIAGIGVSIRLLWVRVPSRIQRPAFLSDWRNIGLIAVTGLALTLLLVLTFGGNSSETGAVLSELGGKPSVAVLPLDNISGDPEQEYLADGIAEDVITLLSRNPRFFVIARNSSFTYKGQAIDIRQVGEQLGVRYVVEGSLRKIGEHLRVTVQLIDTSNGQHLWAEQYDRPTVQVYALQDEITNGIASALGDEIFRAEVARASSVSTDSQSAWGLVMRANQADFIYNNQSTLDAEQLYRQALVIDPDYSLAKAELARSLCWRAVNMFSENPAGDIAEAYALGEQALQKAPDDPLILFDVGACYGATNRRPEAIRMLEKAIAKQPNFAIALGYLGLVLNLDGQSEKSLPYLERSLQHSPQSPHIYLIESWRSFTLNELGQHETAAQALHNALQSYDGWYWTWINLAWARAGLGDDEGAREALYIARKKEPRFSLELIKEATGVFYKNKGRTLLATLEPIWPEDLKTANNE